MTEKTKRVLISVLLWVVAFIMTAGIAVYQKMTGPTFPVRGTEVVNGIEIKYFFFRSWTSHVPIPVKITVTDPKALEKNPDAKISAPQVKAFLNHKRHKANEPWNEKEMTRDGNDLKSSVPGQPAAGKVEYTIRVNIDGENVLINKGKSIVARFKGKVPTWILIIHIIFMFASIMFAVRASFEVFRKEGKYDWMVPWTLGITFIGGMILGPIVQKYAFGDFWTGFPFGTDLTDNKILVAIIFWVLALFLKKKSKWWVIVAATVMLAMYLIPHSVMGSELDYKTGKMKNKFSMNYSVHQIYRGDC